MERPNRQNGANLILVLVAAIWGGGFIAGKMALTDMEPFAVIAFRYCAGAILCAVFLFKRIRAASFDLIKKGVLIGLIHCGLPYMIMILIGPIGNVSQNVEEASYVFGAGFWRTFFKVTLPLTFEGIVSGFILCFALNTAAFVVPVMLGSGKIVVMTTLIYQQATYVYDWGFAAAISVIFLIAAMVLTNLDKFYRRWLLPDRG